MSATSVQRCGSCRFYNGATCQRVPPEDAWPVTSDDWCGFWSSASSTSWPSLLADRGTDRG